ncbi:hypothetical protein ABFS83_14G077000 [Erythranthe nasuta]
MSTHQSKRLKNSTTGTFFKSVNEVPKTPDVDSFVVEQASAHKNHFFAHQVEQATAVDSNQELILERDPGKRMQIWQYRVNQQDEIRRSYIKMGPYQFYLSKYPYSNNTKYPRRFQHSWFAQFPTWLEYSPTTDVAYYLPCYIFGCKPNPRFGANAFTAAGFRNWKKVNDKRKCAFVSHVGDHSSTHFAAVKSCEDLMNQSRHIDNAMMNQSAEQILKNCLRLKTSIDWPKSTNPGNFIELVKLLTRYNDKVSETVLEKASHNAKYTSGEIQKEILHIIATKQMALVLRFVNKVGVLQERFFEICELSTIISHHALSVDNLRGQGYDGASNMRVTAFREVILVHQFFTKLDSIVNIVGASTKRNDWYFTTGRNYGNYYVFCQALQQKSQDILNAMNLVLTTKELLQKLRNNGWDVFLSDVTSFCESQDIEMPDMNGAYKVGRGKSIHQPRDINITIEHHFHFDIFNTTKDTQLKELNSRFCDQIVELLTLSLALDPSNSYKSFNVDDICTLVEKYYPEDFTERERLLLKFQLEHYYLDVVKHPDLCQVPTLATLCEGLVQTKNSEIYYLVDRLIRLILLLPVSTATTERAFSAMKLTKTKLRNKMEDEFLGDCMFLHIERDVANTFSTNSIIENFYTMKDR